MIDRIERSVDHERNVDHVGHGLSNALFNSAREICGETTGYRDRETWWWNEEVELAVREKKLALKKWQSKRNMEAHEQYRRKDRQQLIRIEPGKTEVNLFIRTKEEQRCSR